MGGAPLDYLAGVEVDPLFGVVVLIVAVGAADLARILGLVGALVGVDAPHDGAMVAVRSLRAGASHYLTDFTPAQPLNLEGQKLSV